MVMRVSAKPVNLIKDVIHQVMEGMSVGRPDVQTKIQGSWRKIFNEKDRKHISITGFDKGELLVHADSPAWLFQLNTHKKTTLEKLHQDVPEVTDIRFKIGKVK